MGAYDELIRMARRTMLGQISLTDRLIKQIYTRAAKALAKRLADAKPESLTERWLANYLGAVQTEIERMSGEMESAIAQGARTAVQARVDATADWLTRAAEMAKLDTSFTRTLSSVPTDTLRAMIDGSLYTDGRMLSRRIWDTTGRLEGNITEIIQQGVAQQMDTLQMAQMLEAYVNPKAACPVSWHTLYPDIPFERKVDYNALRLARTSITHAYWAAGKAAAKRNPLCTGMRWVLSDSHYERQIEPAGKDVCDAYAEHDEGLGVGVWPIDKLPMPHPNCLCRQEEVVPSLEDAAKTLGDWANGRSANSALDAGFERWKKENAAELENWKWGEIGPQTVLDKGAERGTINVNLQMFAEADIEKQSSTSLQRAIRNYQRRINDHNEKISNPSTWYSEWDTLSDNQKNGNMRHWKKEIAEFDSAISRRIDELKKRGDWNG